VEIEDRVFVRVLPAVTELIHRFSTLGMQKDGLKARILLGCVHKEMGYLDQAMEILQGVCRDAKEEGESYLQCIAGYDIMQIYCWRGDVRNATAEAERLLPLLSEQRNLVGVGKLLWGLGTLLANQHQFREGIEILRAAQTAFKNLDMNGDAAAIHLVVAELLLGQGQEEAAIEEIKAALPIIRELRLLPEAFAAVALLQDSLNQRAVNREALRKLREFFLGLPR
jgi:tetratricopeptide (TPR) repeat protein